MTVQLAQYKIFIGSPGGLGDVRQRFRERISKFNETHALDQGVFFRPVGWEDTLGGAGRPQEIINDDLRLCDFSIFVLHDHWGSSSGKASSGTEEEFRIAEDLYNNASMLKICVFFRMVPEKQLIDPGENLSKVLLFQKRMREEKKHLYHTFDTVDEFDEIIEKHLAKWLQQHLGTNSEKGTPTIFSDKLDPIGPNMGVPDFRYLLREAGRAISAESVADREAAEYLAKRALAAASSGDERADASILLMAALAVQRKFRNSIAIAEEMLAVPEGLNRDRLQRIRIERASALIEIGRLEEAVHDLLEVCHDLAGTKSHPDTLKLLRARFLLASAFDLKEDRISEIRQYDFIVEELHALDDPLFSEFEYQARTNKLTALRQSGKFAEIVSYTDGLMTVDAVDSLGWSEFAADALTNRAQAQVELLDNFGELATYERTIALFEGFSGASFQETVARALYNSAMEMVSSGKDKDESERRVNRIVRSYVPGITSDLDSLLAKSIGREARSYYEKSDFENEMLMHDSIISKFMRSEDDGLQYLVAFAMWSKAITLRNLQRHLEVIDLLALQYSLYSKSPSDEVRIELVRGVLTRGLSLASLGRDVEVIANYDVAISTFSGDKTIEVRRGVVRCNVMRAMTLHQLGQTEESLLACDECFARYGLDRDEEIKGNVVEILKFKALLFGVLERHHDAIITYDVIIGRLSRDRTPQSIAAYLGAVRHKSALFEKVGSSSASIRSKREAFELFKNSRSNLVKIELASMLLSIAMSYKKDGNLEESVSVINELISKFGKSKNSDISALVVAAEAVSGFS